VTNYTAGWGMFAAEEALCVVRTGTHGKSLYFVLNVAMNLTLLLKKKEPCKKLRLKKNLQQRNGLKDKYAFDLQELISSKRNGYLKSFIRSLAYEELNYWD
jgi:hypothetical protein